MSKQFRSIRKEGIEFQVPPRLADLIREQTRGRRSLSVVGTEILARGLGLDPAEFGIEPTQSIQSTYSP